MGSNIVKVALHYGGNFLMKIITNTTKYVGGYVYFFNIDPNMTCWIDTQDEIATYTKISKEQQRVSFKYTNIEISESMRSISSYANLMNILGMYLCKGWRKAISIDMYVTVRDEEKGSTSCHAKRASATGTMKSSRTAGMDNFIEGIDDDGSSQRKGKCVVENQHQGMPSGLGDSSNEEP